MKIRTNTKRFGISEGLIFALPALLLILVFKVYPLVNGVLLSFTSSERVGTNVYVGLANYAKIFQDKIFLNSLLNLLKIIATIPIFILVPLLMAFAIHQKYKGWRFFRATYFYPYLLPPVMIGYMFGFVLGPNGPFNLFLKRIGLGFMALNWFGTPSIAIYSILLVILWSWFGLGTITFLASMGTVPEALYESARLDGATPRQLLWYITVPHIMPTIGYWTVLITASFFIGLFPFIYALTEGGPGYSTMLPEYYIYLVSTSFLNPGYASALGIILFIFVFVLSIFQVKYMYNSSDED